MAIRRDWNDTENLAVSLAWCVMQASVEQDIKFNKSAIRRALIGSDDAPGPLHARSNSSIEAKLMNCSAVAARHGFGTLPGYKPAPNYQMALCSAMATAYALVRDDIEHGNKPDISIATEV